jgi:hypothetical protein
MLVMHFNFITVLYRLLTPKHGPDISNLFCSIRESTRNIKFHDHLEFVTLKFCHSRVLIWNGYKKKLHTQHRIIKCK